MHQRRGLRPALITGVAGAACLALATPAWANSTISLNKDHEGKTASDKKVEQKCNDERFAGLPADHDGWHFVLPGGSTVGSFTSLTLTFTDNNANAVTINIPDPNDAYPDAFYQAGGRTIHAYLFTPAGWTLKNGTAEVTGTTTEKDKFNLSHACAGTPGEEPTTPPTEEPTEPGEEPTEPGEEPTEPAEEPTEPGEEPTSPATSPAAGDGGGLPLTGAAAGAIALTGVALVGGGAALMVMRRRRDNITFTS